MKPTLKHCPICGNDGELVELAQKRWVVACTSCPIETISSPSDVVVIGFWNKLKRVVSKSRLLNEGIFNE